MDNFLKSVDGFETTLKLIETINRSTDDYLFIWDIPADMRWFFGDIDTHYDIRKNGSETNNTSEMMRIIHPADREAVKKSLAQISSGEKDTHNMDYRWITRDGRTVWINCHGNVIRDSKNQPYLMIGRVSEENLRHLYNPLTSLWNKNKLRLDMKQRLAQGGGSLLLLDVDGLATINLSHGRSYGDDILKEIAQLCENLEWTETAYHVDNNDFALVLNVDSQEEILHVYKQIQEAMAEKCTITASAVPIDKALFLDETQLLDSINMTLKKAQGNGGNYLEFFSAEELSRKITSLELLEEMKQCIENDFEGFEVYYQPQVKAGTYALYGVEALLRYRSPSRGIVFPDEFIPVLEQSRLIQVVGMWVLEQSLAQCKKWRATLPDLHVSVNFSALQFEDPNLAEQVIQKVKNADLPGNALTVEITETMELRNSQQIINTIKNLKHFHINFAIDDFGTGYSNLSYLKQMNVDEIKIDRVFVSGLERATYNHNLISNVIEFAKGNAIRTCCEGVENPQELMTLEFLFPDIIQGYLFDKPNTADAIERRYIHSDFSEYSQRTLFIQKMQELKKKMGIVHFDPKDILRENGVGLWVMRIDREKNQYELHMDEIMENIMAADSKHTATQLFENWFRNIHPDYVENVKNSLNEMISGDKSVQVEFRWQHSQLGNIWMRFSGKRVPSTNDMIVIEGYCRNFVRREREE